MNYENTITIAIFAFFISGLALGFMICKESHGEDFKYNQTKRMQDEEKLLAFCISNTTIKIPDVEKFCGLAYGGLDTGYGDKIK